MMNTLTNNRPENRDKLQAKSFSKMEAIACGVQARFEETMGYKKKVTDETINIARSLGVSNSEIERWAACRLSRISHDRERMQEIKSLLNKAYGLRLRETAKSTRG